MSKENVSSGIICPLCKSQNVLPLAERESVPVMQNVIMNTADAARSFVRKNIALCMCADCEFVFNRYFEGVDYDETYENNQSYSSVVHTYMKGLAERVKQYAQNLSGKVLFVEIGCGQGTFLKMLESTLGDSLDWRGEGYDPAYHSNADSAHLHFASSYFDADLVHTAEYDNVVIISRHVIEHIKDPHFMLGECEKMKARNVHLFLETPNFNWILDNGAFEDIVYEHCSFFNPRSMQTLFDMHGFAIKALCDMFGGQYMLIEARRKADLPYFISKYRETEAKKFTYWLNVLSKNKSMRKPTLLWGGGLKASLSSTSLTVMDRM